MSQYTFFEIEKQEENKIAIVYLNRPDARNAMSWNFWSELPLVVQDLEKDDSVRCAVIAGRGKSFSTGLDLMEFKEKFQNTINGATADTRMKLYDLILEMQEGFRRILNSRKPYIAAIQRHCIGGALDLICACDIRLASKNASISLRETKVAIVADMCSLNRLPHLIGESNTRMMAFTGADYSAEKCYEMGLVNEVLESEDDLQKRSVELATEIAANPAIVLHGVKTNLNYMQNHSTDEGLDFVATWNAAFLDSDDFRELMQAFSEKRRPRYK